jgi:PhoH-like ATPase
MEDKKDNTPPRKIAYVLDTNVLIHDPDSVLHFEEHRVIIPMTVLEELDKLKSVQSRRSRWSAAPPSVSSTAILGDAEPEKIRQGVPIWRDLSRTFLGTLVRADGHPRQCPPRTFCPTS